MEEDEQQDLWNWVMTAVPGDVILHCEGLLYQVCLREKNRILLFNYEAQIYEALRLSYVCTKPVQLDEMD